MNQINVAFLGAGRMGLTHLRNLVGLAGVQVRVVADHSLAHAQAGAAIVRADRASDDVGAAIGADDVDAVLIATPTGTHAELIEQCARAGKPVWCEKPAALTLADHVATRGGRSSEHPTGARQRRSVAPRPR